MPVLLVLYYNYIYSYIKGMQTIMRLPESLGHEERIRSLHFIGEVAAGWCIVALFTFSGYILHFNVAPMEFVFLLVVVIEAIFCGFWQASVVSLLACACLDYFFYPPLLSFNINDTQDWIALGTFEIIALIVSRLSSRERLKSHEAELQGAAIEQLYELSRSTLLINLHQPPGPQLTQLIRRIFSAEAVAIFNLRSGICDTVGDWKENEKELAKECYLQQIDEDNRLTHTFRRLLKNGDDCMGAIAIRGVQNPLVVNALASLAAITLERCVFVEKESQVEAAHQSERFRAAVLDSLAHEIKTPLTAIQAANAGLSEVGGLNEAQAELAMLVEDESNKLSLICTRLLQTAKLEAEEMVVGKDEIAMKDLISNTLKEMSGHMAGHRVEVEMPDPNLSVRGDRELLAMALAQYLDNAAKYSFAGTAVKVSAWESHSEVMISVHNFGPAVPIAERERIFQRFYRSAVTSRLAAGTGIGLSTVKLAAEAHRGHAWVISDDQEGTTFFLCLPQYGGRNQ